MGRASCLLTALALAAAAPAQGASWFWAYSGGTNPVKTTTAEGKAGWSYNPVPANASGAGYQVVTTEPLVPVPPPADDPAGTYYDKALRVIDNSATAKPMWNAIAGQGLLNNVPGFTLAFRIKGEELGESPASILQFVNTLQGASGNVKNNIQLRLNRNSAGDIVLQNMSYANETLGVVSDGFHEVWVKSTVESGKIYQEVFFDGVSKRKYQMTSNPVSTFAKFGTDTSNTGTAGTAVYQLDYLAYANEAASPGDIAAPVVPEPATLGLLAVGVFGLLRNRRSR